MMKNSMCTKKNAKRRETKFLKNDKLTKMLFDVKINFLPFFSFAHIDVKYPYMSESRSM